MAGEPHGVFGLYDKGARVEEAVERLKERGFRNTDISVLLPAEAKISAAQTQVERSVQRDAARVSSEYQPGLGWLTGLGPILIPGMGSFLAAGPVVAALAGIGVHGPTRGLTGALVSLGMPEYEAKRYVTRVAEGGMLLSVRCEDEESVNSAKQVLEATGAWDISAADENSRKPSDSERQIPFRRPRSAQTPAQSAAEQLPKTGTD